MAKVFESKGILDSFFSELELGEECNEDILIECIDQFTEENLYEKRKFTLKVTKELIEKSKKKIKDVEVDLYPFSALVSHHTTPSIYLLDKFPNYDVNKYGEGDNPPMTIAMIFNNIKMVEKIMNFPGFDINLIFNNHCYLQLFLQVKNDELRDIFFSHPEIDVNIKIKVIITYILDLFKIII
eukprot:TRINITY_DN2465_c0_g1_i1.p1 TRINITY_DN2465_c0_g1~~TRINITY_DN2465_c0_g1_i1.p1  ORF type:complete len:183 (+),score=31.81 TRINITY_DN2465_c0_g1_i1:88-636(+)